MNLKALTSAILFASVPMTGAFAAAMDRSGQSISAFLQPGNYFEAGISVLDADVSGKLKDNYTVTGGGANTAKSIQGTELGDMAESYHFYNAALKVQMTDNVSFGLIYDQPFGAKAKYSTNDKRQTDSVSLKTNEVGAFTVGDEATSVDVNTQNLSFIFGYQPNENWNIYAGPVYQTVKGDVTLRGSAYGPFGGVNCPISACSLNSTIQGTKDKFNGYEARIAEDSSVGWLAGFAFQIPEIALKASVTYRSEIEHSVTPDEVMPANSLMGGLGGIKPMVDGYEFKEGKTDVTTPQSVNLDFQTGIMANTVAFAQLRWVDWSEFKIRPNKFGQLASALTNKVIGDPRGFDLVAYEKDQISANVGVGRKFNEQWAGTVMVGWDSGAGNPVSTLGPTEGYWSLGLGGQFSPTPQTFVQAGVKYFWLGDAKSQVASHFGTDEYAANFKDNDAIGYSLKIGYRF
ncbi:MULTISPECIES: OmpP1/FadL family transporter [Acinetobacter]|uniref:OmpP1/FadL family transporter n=1 Tax=Acinetobacter TaxID=469 RepID=UPI0009922BEE|nr:MULTISPECIES: outer membrane protein transport protein [Acinetobacter]MCL6246133.1 outer membrane protein transport protein [Acinetobacter amyesii]OOV82182.1 transporter [Acinetobacter sp. ANC 5600]